MWPFRKRKHATYAKPKPKQVVFTVDEVAKLVATVAVLADRSGVGFLNYEDSEILELVARCREACQLFHNGHKVTIFVPFGDYSE